MAEPREGRAAATDGGDAVEQVEYNGSEKARYIAMISSEQNTCIYVLYDSEHIARWFMADQEQVQETTKLMDVGVKATSNDPDNLAVKKSIEKSLLDLDLDAEVSDELDEELYGQFADVISKVCKNHE